MTLSFIDPRGMSSPAPSTSSATASSPSPADEPKKKRKSWGQVLPVPTTNLPPRKRAKTTEEKQQRLYERVQRNRQAAHNSRMRKQDEMERATAENNRLRQDNQHLQDEVTRLKDEIRLLRGSSSPIPSSSHNMTFHDLPQRPSTPSLTMDSSMDADSPLSSQYDLGSLPIDQKLCDDSHSAEMCSRQWTSNTELLSMKIGPMAVC